MTSVMESDDPTASLKDTNSQETATGKARQTNGAAHYASTTGDSSVDAIEPPKTNGHSNGTEDDSAKRKADGTSGGATREYADDPTEPTPKRSKLVEEPSDDIVLDADEPSTATTAAAAASSSQQTNGTNPAEKSTADKSKRTTDGDDDIEILDVQGNPAKPYKLSSSEDLLDHIEKYMTKIRLDPNAVDRKVLDLLLAAINEQVQREPLSVRRLILEKQLVLPNTISFPPSQVVELLIEHDPDAPLARVIPKIFGSERPKWTDQERRERQFAMANFGAPYMSKALVDIGLDLAQEFTYCDVVNARNLPEQPKDMEKYKQVAAQLRPVWEQLRRKNETYRPKTWHSCILCGFRTESLAILNDHKRRPHNDGRRWQCTHCPEVDTNEARMWRHYLDVHDEVAVKEAEPPKNPCPLCEMDFQYKGPRDAHLRMCKKDYVRVRQVQAKQPNDELAINSWLWPRPKVDPTAIGQQTSSQQRQRQSHIQSSSSSSSSSAYVATTSLAGPSRPGFGGSQAQNQQRPQLMRTPIRQPAMDVSGTTATYRQAAAAMLEQSKQHVFVQKIIQRLLQFTQNSVRQTSAQQQAELAKILHDVVGESNNAGAAAISQKLTQYLRKMSEQNRQAGGTVSAKEVALGLIDALRGIGKPPNGQSLAHTNGGGPLPPTPSTSQPSTSAGLNRHTALPTGQTAHIPATPTITCEICDSPLTDRNHYFTHLQGAHGLLKGRTLADMATCAPLACSRCKERFYTYEGLERHLVMQHSLVTSDLLEKARKKQDQGRCKICRKQFAFNLLQHLVHEHKFALCTAEIQYSCDVCSFTCQRYALLDAHLAQQHPKSGPVFVQQQQQQQQQQQEKLGRSSTNNDDDCITLD